MAHSHRSRRSRPRHRLGPLSEKLPRRPDIDKHCRACLDSLTGIVWRDDAQVVRLEASKDYGIPSVMIWVEPIASREVAATMEESEIGEVDTQSISHALRRVESDNELEDFF